MVGEKQKRHWGYRLLGLPLGRGGQVQAVGVLFGHPLGNWHWSPLTLMQPPQGTARVQTLAQLQGHPWEGLLRGELLWSWGTPGGAGLGLGAQRVEWHKGPCPGLLHVKRVPSV